MTRVARSFPHVLAATIALGLASIASPALAQSSDPFARVFGRLGQTLAGNIRNAILVRNQQVISSLPPSSPQGVAFEYDPAVDTYVRTDLPGTSAFLSPDTIGLGRWAFQLSTSYFELRPLEKRTNYLVGVDLTAIDLSDLIPVQKFSGVGKYGVSASAQTTLVSVAASYGLTESTDIELTVPITFVRATTTFVYGADVSNSCLLDNLFLGPIGQFPLSDVCLSRSTRELDDFFADGKVVSRGFPIALSGVDGLDGSTQIGLGRVGLAGKTRFHADERFRLAGELKVLFPSPNEAEFSGTDTWAIFPRLIAAIAIRDALEGHVDLGYECDLTQNDLRRFAWSTGVTWATEWISADVGLSGSVYNEGVRVFVSDASETIPLVDNPDFIRQSVRIDLTSLDAQTLSSNFVDAVVGFKTRLGSRFSLSGVATIPIVNVEFRPEAIGTISFEVDL